MNRLIKCSLLATALLLPFVSCKKDTPTPTPPAPTPPLPTKPFSPGVTRVLDYRPAPGQFVNKLPEYKDGDTQETMNAKVLENLIHPNNKFITLGSWGGYVVVGFDHTIQNVSGKRDFRVLGNAFGGSSEPGIIYVAYDKNKNGKPDEDEWYEIAGSATLDPSKETWYAEQKTRGFDVSTYRDYAVTYYYPPTEEAKEIENYIPWRDNKGKSGFLAKNKWHQQIYYPQWIKERTYELRGTRLPQNGYNKNKPSETPFYICLRFAYGYVDNAANTEKEATIDIDWAIDKDGKPVHLPGVDFVRVQTGILQVNGWLGENSTEFAGIQDLHVLKENIPTK